MSIYLGETSLKMKVFFFLNCEPVQFNVKNINQRWEENHFSKVSIK